MASSRPYLRLKAFSPSASWSTPHRDISHGAIPSAPIGSSSDFRAQPEADKDLWSVIQFYPNGFSRQQSESQMAA
jgi:hypothetical protein